MNSKPKSFFAELDNFPTHKSHTRTHVDFNSSYESPHTSTRTITYTAFNRETLSRKIGTDIVCDFQQTMTKTLSVYFV